MNNTDSRSNNTYINKDIEYLYLYCYNLYCLYTYLLDWYIALWTIQYSPGFSPVNLSIIDLLSYNISIIQWINTYILTIYILL